MSSSIRLGAIFWLLTAEFFLAQIIAQTALPGFSLATQDISLLGVTACGADASASGYACSPLHLVFNAGIFINGMLVVVGLWLTRTMWPQGRLTTAALWLLALGGDGSMLVGLFPLDQNLGLHMFGAFLALGTFLSAARIPKAGGVRRNAVVYGDQVGLGASLLGWEITAGACCKGVRVCWNL